MKHQVIYRSNWAMSIAILLIFAIVGCTGQVAAPTLPPESSPTTEASSSTPEAATSPTEPGVEQTATSEPAPDSNVLYQDDFTNPATGWAVAEFGSYFIGYHEPESYHVEIQSPHLPAPVISIPDAAAHNYPDATIELAVQTVSGKTSTEGDYRYGIVFRQSGANYYAFTISPTNKKWEVFKSSPSGFTPLKDGIEESIQGLDVDDLLHVDAQGSHFLFYINDKLVGQVTDTDYPGGTVGLYAENLENVKTHVHFNTLTVREVKFSMMCNILEGGTVNVRSGPSTSNPQIGVLSSGDAVQAKGISSNQWIQIVVEGSNEPGWISWADPSIRRVTSCTPSVDAFPVINP
jgi:hypothetical protein